MKAVILVGGYGTRLSEKTTLIPKPMVEIGGKPILWHLMKYYSTFGIDDFVLCLGYKGDLIKEYFLNIRAHTSDIQIDLTKPDIKLLNNGCESWKITMIDTGLDTGTAGRLAKVRKYLGNEPFHMTYGDGLADIDLENLMLAHNNHDKLVTVTGIIPPTRYGYLKTDGEIVTSFNEKPQIDSDSRINGGFFVIDPKALELIEDNAEMWEKGPMEKLVAQKELAAFNHDGFWQCMDTLRDQQMLEKLWDTGKADWKVWA